MSVSRFSRWGLMAVVLLIAAAHSAFAQPQSPSASASPPVVAKPTLFNAGGKAPSIDSIPALKNLVSNGARLITWGIVQVFTGGLSSRINRCR